MLYCVMWLGNFLGLRMLSLDHVIMGCVGSLDGLCVWDIGTGWFNPCLLSATFLGWTLKRWVRCGSRAVWVEFDAGAELVQSFYEVFYWILFKYYNF
jgi:hypothetical protein